MKKLLAIALVAMLAGSAFAQATWLGNAYLIVDGATWYNMTNPDDTFTAALPSSLTLTVGSLIGFELQQYPNGSSGGFGWDTYVHYTLDNWTTVETVKIPFSSGSPEEANTKHVKHDVIQITEAMNGATLELTYFSSQTGDSLDANNVWNTSGNQSVTLNVTAAAVPEPATMSLLGLGALALAVRRKLRK